MTNLKYVVGDVREPIRKGNENAIICHCVNDKRVMGSGVAKALYEKWSDVREKYMEWGQTKDFALGKVQFVPVEKKIAVANMVGQHDIVAENGIPPIRYKAIKSCFEKIRETAIRHNCSIHLPYLVGCDRAGGDWQVVEQIIKDELCFYDISVIIYDLFNKRNQ